MNTPKDLIAVITAAILAMTEGKTNIVIKSIKKRTPNSASNWAFAGRRKRAWK
jgi:hypothetical protein